MWQQDCGAGAGPRSGGGAARTAWKRPFSEPPPCGAFVSVEPSRLYLTNVEAERQDMRMQSTKSMDTAVTPSEQPVPSPLPDLCTCQSTRGSSRTNRARKHPQGQGKQRWRAWGEAVCAWPARARECARVCVWRLDGAARHDGADEY